MQARLPRTTNSTGPQTRERYTRALARWDALLEEFRVSGFEEKSEEEQDFIMCELLFEVRANGDMSLQEGRDLVAALQKRYLHRRKFTSTSWLLRAWQSLQPATQAAPMPENVCYAIFVLLVVLGFEGEGLALLLAFVGLMRISEVVNLEISDVHFLVGEGGAENLVLVLRKSKRGIPMGEKVVLTNMVVLACVRDFLLKKKKLGAKAGMLCEVTYYRVRRCLGLASKALGYGEDTFRTHSCRRGGASALALKGISLQDIMHFGRWASESSCRVYVKEGEVLLLKDANEQTEQQRQRILKLARLACVVLRGLPVGHKE